VPRALSKVRESATELLAERGIAATSVDNTLTPAGKRKEFLAIWTPHVMIEASEELMDFFCSQ
jgi:hypothetical protein